MLLNVKKMKKHIAVLAVVAIVLIGGVGTAVAALATENTFKASSLTRNSSTPIMESEVNGVLAMCTSVNLDSIDGLKMVELKSDGKEYTFEEFKQWLSAARLEAAELVKLGIWTQEQADKKLALYENTLADIEQKGGKIFRKLIDKGDEVFPEKVDIFYTTDELVFELPEKLADTTNGEVGYGLSVKPKK